MSLEEIQQNAALNGCWIRMLGQDENGLFHAVAGSNWIIKKINQKLKIQKQKPIESFEQIPLKVVLDLDLPVESGKTQAQAAKNALAKLREMLEQNNSTEIL